MEYKGCLSEVKELSNKGQVQFYASVFGNRDYGDDIIENGAMRKTISENYKSIRHFKHHDSWKMAGVIQELKEDNFGLLVNSQLILNTQLGRETYEEYKAMAEAGKSMDHSIGYRVIRSENDEVAGTRRIKELQLFEVSTLTAWGMNPLAQTVAIKSLDTKSLDELLKDEKYFNILLNAPFTDAKLESLEALKNHVTSLIEQKRRLVHPSGDAPINGGELVQAIKFIL